MNQIYPLGDGRDEIDLKFSRLNCSALFGKRLIQLLGFIIVVV